MKNRKDILTCRIGETNSNSLGSIMVVEEYKNSKDILVKFVDYGNTVRTSWTNFCNGKVKNVYDKSVLGVGYIGEGEYKVSIDCTFTRHYQVWISMLKRCYDPFYIKKNLTYKGCFVCEEWHNFQNFAKWYEENFYEVGKENMQLDKDILIKGNKIYSPDTCVFVPQGINKLFLKRESKRGNLPIGVYLNKTINKYVAVCRNYRGKKKFNYLGCYSDFETAFLHYKIYKENVIKDTAEEYKPFIPKNLYVALLNYQVEIDD